MNKLHVTFIFSLFFFPMLLRGQETTTIDLPGCISVGLKNNFNIMIALNNQFIADNNFTLGNAGFLPEVTFTNRFAGTINTTNQELSDGAETSAKGVHNITNATGINLGMTIFRGFQVQTTYRKLEEIKKVGELNTQMAMENLLAGIASEYFFFVEQLSLYRNLDYAVTLSRERVRIDEQRYLLGSSSKMDLLQSIVYFNSDSSRLDRQKEVLRASQVRLNELMASPDLGMAIIPRDTVIGVSENLKYKELLELTLLNNTSLRIAARQQRISNLDYKIISSRNYPYLTASTGYSYNYYGYEASSVQNQQVHGMNYGFTLGLDVFDGLNRKREQANARLEIKNREYQYREIEQEVKADLLTIFYGYENNLRLLRLEEQNLAVARENLEIAMERYKLGSLAGLELREVQKSLLDAEERMISAKYLTKIAEISLMQISGKIMNLAYGS